jgi:hypothetical protein
MKKKSAELKKIFEEQIEEGKYREVCWDLEQRGSVGETW